jgi:hypothetical protein
MREQTIREVAGIDQAQQQQGARIRLGRTKGHVADPGVERRLRAGITGGKTLVMEDPQEHAFLLTQDTARHQPAGQLFLQASPATELLHPVLGVMGLGRGADGVQGGVQHLVSGRRRIDEHDLLVATVDAPPKRQVHQECAAKPVRERGRASPGDRPLVVVEREQQQVFC